MIDIKFPTGSTWHNISIRQATEAKKLREEREIQALRLASSTNKQAQLTVERSQALLLQSSTNPNLLQLGSGNGGLSDSILRGDSSAQSEARISQDNGPVYQTVDDSGEEEEEEIFQPANE